MVPRFLSIFLHQSSSVLVTKFRLAIDFIAFSKIWKMILLGKWGKFCQMHWFLADYIFTSYLGSLEFPLCVSFVSGTALWFAFGSNFHSFYLIEQSIALAPKHHHSFLSLSGWGPYTSLLRGHPKFVSTPRFYNFCFLQLRACS